MLQRRSFLGSIIGSFMSGNFFARLDTEPFQFEEIKKYPYRLLFREANSCKVFQATPIVDILPCSNPEYDAWDFIAGTFDCTTTLAVQGVILIDNRGHVIGENNFHYSHICTTNGDKLKITYRLRSTKNIGVQTPDEMCQLRLNPLAVKALDRNDLDGVKDWLNYYRSSK